MTFQDDFLQNQNQELVEYMKSSRLFSHIPQPLLEGLVPLSELRVYNPGDDILTEGQENDLVFFLIRGCVQIYSGGEFILELKRQGDIFGEMSVISSKPASATVAAKTRVQVFTLRGRNIGKYTDIDVERINHILYRLFAAVLTDKLALTTYKARQYEVVNVYLNKTQVALAEKHSQNSREMQTALQIADQKTKFIENLSRELQSPLQLLIDLSEQTSSGASSAELSAQMLQTAKGALGLLRDVVEYSEISPEPAQKDPEAYDLLSSIEAISAQAKSLSQTHQVSFQKHVELGKVSTLFGDGAQCERLLIRILHHAFLTTEHGGVQLSISRFIGDDGDEVLFEVNSEWPVEFTDHVEEIFLPFSQTQRQHKLGTGLDLSIANKQIKGMDGRIWFSSAKNQRGSIFVSLPVHPLPPVSQQNCLIPNTIKVLLFEENLRKADQLIGLLESWDLSVHLVCDQEALQTAMFSPEKYNLLVVAEPLDEESAFSLIELRTLDPNRDLPVIWLQTYDQSQKNNEQDELSKMVITPIRTRSLHQNIVELLSLVQDPEKPAEYLARQYPLHILVAEDNQVLQNKLKNHLTNMGYQPDFVNDGSKVISLSQGYAYDVILLDADMPNVSGTKAAQLVRETHGLKCPYLIGLCHPTEEIELLQNYQSSFDDLLFKPVSVLTLRAYLESCGKKIFDLEEKSDPKN